MGLTRSSAPSGSLDTILVSESQQQDLSVPPAQNEVEVVKDIAAKMRSSVMGGFGDAEVGHEGPQGDPAGSGKGGEGVHPARLRNQTREVRSSAPPKCTLP